jgi:tyrosyl-tRNA synthetase
MLEREDFRSRLDNKLPISVHELLYPLLTAVDAVELKSDVELGATEQKFNILVHRDIQREYGLSAEIVFTMPILVGLDGERKMSKSLGNYVGITEPPDQMFGKLMSISDEMMWSYMDLLTDRTPAAIAELRAQVTKGAAHPMETKIALAQEIIAGFRGSDAAAHAAENFNRVFRERKSPEEAPEFRVASGAPKRLSALIAESGLAASRAEADRLIKQNAVDVDGAPVSDVKHELSLTSGAKYLVRAGKKKFVRLVVE